MHWTGVVSASVQRVASNVTQRCKVWCSNGWTQRDPLARPRISHSHEYTIAPPPNLPQRSFHEEWHFLQSLKSSILKNKIYLSPKYTYTFLNILNLVFEKSLQENDEKCEGIIENPLLHSIDLNVPLWFRSIGFPPFLGKLNILIEFPHCHSCDSLQSIFYTKSCKKEIDQGWREWKWRE